MSDWEELHYNIDTGSGTRQRPIDLDSIVIVHNCHGETRFGTYVLCSRCRDNGPDFRLTYKDYIKRSPFYRNHKNERYL